MGCSGFLFLWTSKASFRLGFRNPNPTCLYPIPEAALLTNNLPYLAVRELHNVNRTTTKSIQTFSGEREYLTIVSYMFNLHCMNIRLLIKLSLGFFGILLNLPYNLIGSGIIHRITFREQPSGVQTVNLIFLLVDNLFCRSQFILKVCGNICTFGRNSFPNLL